MVAAIIVVEMPAAVAAAALMVAVAAAAAWPCLAPRPFNNWALDRKIPTIPIKYPAVKPRNPKAQIS